MEMGSVIVEKEKKVLTMAEYIEREAISEEIRKYYYKNPPNFSYGEGFDRGLDRAQRAILDAPAADVAEVRHGRWISLTECANEGVYCSICKKKVWKSDYAWCSKKSRNKLQSNYCPNCGAKMDGCDGNSAICSKTT